MTRRPDVDSGAHRLATPRGAPEVLFMKRSIWIFLALPFALAACASEQKTPEAPTAGSPPNSTFDSSVLTAPGPGLGGEGTPLGSGGGLTPTPLPGVPGGGTTTPQPTPTPGSTTSPNPLAPPPSGATPGATPPTPGTAPTPGALPVPSPAPGGFH